MRARIEREWLQKHPTPHAADGDFHWYPGTADVELRAELASSTEAERTLWLAPGRVVASRRFAALAPGDGRRYVGLAVTIVRAPGASVAALLGAVAMPAAAPWDREAIAADAMIAEPGELSAGEPVTADLADALWHGGTCAELAPSRCAAAETWLPAAVRAAPRRLALGDAREPTAAARWLAAAVATRGPELERARRAWRAVMALAAVEDRSLESMFTELASLDPDAAQWSRALHAWGRAGSAAERDRLASLLARRAVADLLAGAAAHRWRAILRWESLLPTARADELERATSALLAERPRG